MTEPTVEERLARIEEAISGLRDLINNHILHAIRSLDAKVWGVIVAVMLLALGMWFK